MKCYQIDVSGKRGKDVELEYCIICNRPVDSGLRIFSSVVCRKCEEELVRASAADPNYLIYVDKIRRALPSYDGALY